MSVKAVVPLNILLLPALKTSVTPAPSSNSWITVIGLEPKGVALVVITSKPLRAAIRPRLSMTALSATSANDGS